MRRVTLSQARARFHALLRDVQSGEEFLITRNGRNIAWLVPFAGYRAPAKRPLDLVRMLGRIRGNVRGKVNIIAYRDAGRKR